MRVILNGVPIVLFRHSGGVSALDDQCPHRLVELSKGQVIQDTLQCPYHGWRFGADGQCVAIPGCLADLPRVRVRHYQTCEREGGIFLTSGNPQGPPNVHPMEHTDHVCRVVKSSTRSTVLDAAENILDATHTHFTHKGLLRGLSDRRYRVQVEVTGGSDCVEASYVGEDRQDGLISRLLDGTRTKGIGRYRRPGIAELEYWGPKGLVLATTFHLRQVDPETVEGIGWLVAPREGWLGSLKALAFKPLFNIALQQDRRVLRSAFDNARGAKPMVGPLDFLRREIEALERGEAVKPGPKHYEIEL